MGRNGLQRTVRASVSLLAAFICYTLYFRAIQSSQWNEKLDLDGYKKDANRLVKIFAEFNHPSVAADDPRLLTALRQHYLHPPSLRQASAGGASSLNDESMGQSGVVDALFRRKRGGFFVECGALDGRTYSNSLFLERERGWTGLLMEPDPSQFAKLVKAGRAAYTSQACLAQTTHPQMVSYSASFLTGHVVTEDSDFSGGLYDVNSFPSNLISAQCFPLHSMLLALNRSTVDYFSLDIEGSELAVLRAVPWQLLDVKVLSVEFQHQSLAGKQELRSYMESVGYSTLTEVTFGKMANDFIFAKQDLAQSAQDVDLVKAKALPPWAVDLVRKTREESKKKNLTMYY